MFIDQFVGSTAGGSKVGSDAGKTTISNALQEGADTTVNNVEPLSPLAGIRLGIVKLDAGLSQVDLDSFLKTLVAMSKLGLNPIIMLDFESLQSSAPKLHHHNAEALQKVISVLPHRRRRFGTGLLNKSPIPSTVSVRGGESSGLSALQRTNLQKQRVLMLHESERIVGAIERVGGRAVSMMHSRVFTSKEGFVSCDAGIVLRHMKRGVFPVLVPMAEHQVEGTSVGTTVSVVQEVRVQSCLLAVAEAVEGSESERKPIGLVNLVEEGSGIMQEISGQLEMTPHCHRTLQDLKLAENVLAVLAAGLSASSSAIIGSFPGRATDSAENWDESDDSMLMGLKALNVERLGVLLEASFGKKLHSAAYFERITGVVDSVILAGDYEGASGKVVYYLDKFAVRPESQGLGIADILWKRFDGSVPEFVLAVEDEESCNKWYFDRSDGNMKFGDDYYWMMFWYGREGLSQLTDYKKVCEGIEASFH
ncbi:hypothetical protein BDR26DRAFT_906816 [Obelidium mucronatum]|nr:hypothetical protein BDR26DRAFT_906816 [Obelidium mucronatum]